MGPCLRKRQKMRKPEIYKINPIGPELKTNALYDRSEELFEGSNPVLSAAGGDVYLVSEEHSVYGASRLGLNTRKDTLYKNTVQGAAYTYVFRQLGAKQYELSNHLGNVLTTVTDQKRPNSSGGTSIDNYNPVIVTISDYYPFGSIMPGRSWVKTGKDYRLGFNGQEKDFETANDNYDFGARIYDGRIGRWLGLDPLLCITPWNSPFVAFSDDPINRIDPSGMADFYTKDGKHLGSDGKNDDIAYTTTEAILNENTTNGSTNWDKVAKNGGTSKCSLKNSELLKSAATIYAETSGNKNESYGIASATNNMAKQQGVTFMDQIKAKNYSYCYGSDRYEKFLKTKASSRSIDMTDCIGAVLNSVTGGKDYSNGATHWDGRDVFVKGKNIIDIERQYTIQDKEYLYQKILWVMLKIYNRY
jgi:RHS repeat-associated protein